MRKMYQDLVVKLHTFQTSLSSLSELKEWTVVDRIHRSDGKLERVREVKKTDTRETNDNTSTTPMIDGIVDEM